MPFLKDDIWPIDDVSAAVLVVNHGGLFTSVFKVYAEMNILLNTKYHSIK